MSLVPRIASMTVFVNSDTNEEITLLPPRECKCGPDQLRGVVRPGCLAHDPIAKIAQAIDALDPEQWAALRDRVSETRCLECGTKTTAICHCTNDE